MAPLNQALADEWLAHYQYLKGALVLSFCLPKTRTWFQAIKELRQHAQDERRHAHWLMNIITMNYDEIPILEPARWKQIANCPYLEPKPDFQTIITQNIHGEECAIKAYNALLSEVGRKSLKPVCRGRRVNARTVGILRKILREEKEHLKDLRAILKQL